VVYEAAGSVSPQLLAAGAQVVRRAGETYRMPVEVVEQPPSQHGEWLTAMTAAVARTLQ